MLQQLWSTVVVEVLKCPQKQHRSVAGVSDSVHRSVAGVEIQYTGQLFVF